MRIIYGPISSTCLGTTIAVDPIGRHPKACNFNCIYCRLGQRGMVLLERTVFIDDALILEQMGECIHRDECDAVVFKGTGEPLLATNIFSMARMIKKAAPKKVAILTNCSLLQDPDVLSQLDAFDVIVAKLDAASDETFRLVNRPHPSIGFSDVISGMKEARRHFHGSFRIQVTVVRENQGEMEGIAQICRDICPDLVYLNCPDNCDRSHQLSKREVQEVWEKFSDVPCSNAREKI